jgi:hypothetical protein
MAFNKAESKIRNCYIKFWRVKLLCKHKNLIKQVLLKAEFGWISTPTKY